MHQFIVVLDVFAIKRLKLLHGKSRCLVVERRKLSVQL